jgi:hypothetical protein
VQLEPVIGPREDSAQISSENLGHYKYEVTIRGKPLSFEDIDLFRP